MQYPVDLPGVVQPVLTEDFIFEPGHWFSGECDHSELSKIESLVMAGQFALKASHDGKELLIRCQITQLDATGDKLHYTVFVCGGVEGIEITELPEATDDEND